MDSIDSTTVLIKESASILALNTSENFKDPEDNNVERVGKSDRIAPWGSDNLLPQHVVKAVEKNEVMFVRGTSAGLRCHNEVRRQ